MDDSLISLLTEILTDLHLITLFAMEREEVIRYFPLETCNAKSKKTKNFLQADLFERKKLDSGLRK